MRCPSSFRKTSTTSQGPLGPLGPHGRGQPMTGTCGVAWQYHCVSCETIALLEWHCRCIGSLWIHTELIWTECTMQTFTLCEGWRANSSSHWRGHRNSSRSLHYPMLLMPQNLFQFFKCIQNCHIETFDIFIIWGWVKTLVPSEPQNSWVKMDVHPTKNGIFIGIDPYPFDFSCFNIPGPVLSLARIPWHIEVVLPRPLA